MSWDLVARFVAQLQIFNHGLVKDSGFSPAGTHHISLCVTSTLVTTKYIEDWWCDGMSMKMAK